MDYTQLHELVHDRPLEDLVRAISHRSDRDTIARLLDVELERRQKHFRLLEEYRSRLRTPIHTLPTELLSLIFFLSACDDDYKTLFSLGWTHLLLVCRRWHDVVDLERLSTLHPGLLGRSIFSRIARQRERVGTSAMHVRMYVPDLTPVRVDAFLLPYQPFFWDPSSLVSLRVFGATNRLSELFTRMGAVDHPRLTSLAALNTDNPDNKSLLSFDDEFLRKLLSKHASLRELHFASVSFNVHLLRDLRSLNLAYFDDAPITFETNDILDAILRCPTLEFLRLKLQSSALPPLTDRSRGVDLLNLGRIELEGASTTCTKLLTALKLMPKTRILVNTLDEAHPQDLLQLLSHLRAHCNHPDAPQITSLALNEVLPNDAANSISFCTGIQLTSAAKSLKNGTRKPAESCFVCLGFFASTDENWADIAAIALPHFPLQNVSVLDIRRMDVCDLVLLQPFFDLLPAPCTIAVNFATDAFDELFYALRPRLVNQSRLPFYRIILDAAEGLAQIDPSWDPEDWEYEIERTREQFSDALRYCFEAKEADKPLDILEIINDGDVRVVPPTVSFVLQVPLKCLWRDLAVGFIRNGMVLNRGGFWVEL